MYSVNRAQIIGYLTQDPEIRKTPGDISVGNLNILTKYRFKNKDGQEQTGNSFHNIVIWRGLADICGQYLRQGSQVYISGRLKTDEWEGDDGQKRYKTRIVADEMIMLDSRTPIEEIGSDSPIQGFLNKAEVIGNLTRDPEIRQTPSGISVTTIRVATNFVWKDKGGADKEMTEFHSIVLWDKLAEEAAKYLQKGKKVYASGRLQTRSWETPNGDKRYATEIVAEDLSALGAKISGMPESQQTDEKEPAMATKTTETKAAKGEVTEDMIPEINYESDVKPEDLPF